MLFRKTMVFCMVMVFFVLGTDAVAQEDLTCADIEWLPVVTNKYPDIANACVGVVVKNGKTMAKLRAEIVSVRSGKANFRFLNTDGTRSDVYQTDLGPGWVVMIDGRKVRQRDLARGQQLNVYMPNDRWAVIYEDEDGPDLADAVTVVEYFELEDEPEPAATLPSTASPLPLAGLIGAGFLALGAGLRIVRRRVR